MNKTEATCHIVQSETNLLQFVIIVMKWLINVYKIKSNVISMSLNKFYCMLALAFSESGINLHRKCPFLSLFLIILT